MGFSLSNICLTFFICSCELKSNALLGNGFWGGGGGGGSIAGARGGSCLMRCRWGSGCRWISRPPASTPPAKPARCTDFAVKTRGRHDAMMRSTRGCPRADYALGCSQVLPCGPLEIICHINRTAHHDKIHVGDSRTLIQQTREESSRHPQGLGVRRKD